eukprot:614395-Pyramimonas_sp.AAC.1
MKAQVRKARRGSGGGLEGVWRVSGPYCTVLYHCGDGPAGGCRPTAALSRGQRARACARNPSA